MNMMHMILKEAIACIIVFDLTRKTTFQAVTEWKTILDKHVRLPDGNAIPCILLGNKVGICSS